MADTTEDSDLRIRSRISGYVIPEKKMCDRLYDYLTEKEVKAMLKLLGRFLEPTVQCKIKNGRDLYFALAKQDNCEENNFFKIIEKLKLIGRHDVVHVSQLREKAKVTLDPLEEYLKTLSQVPQNINPVASCSQTLRISGRDKISETGTSSSDSRISFPGSIPPPAKRRRSTRIFTRQSLAKQEQEAEENSESPRLRKKHTCDVRLRVRAEYCNYDTVLEGNVSSMRQDLTGRQMECFAQASAILRTRDLGFIVCDIKFSEITYLDAFWRDYRNGSLLEALKGVFITESLKQAVGNEAIKLLVNVDESDYEKGRLILMNNLPQSL